MNKLEELEGIVKSRTFRCGKRTYFFDIKKARTGKKYLQITETRLVEEEEKRKRNSIMVFPEDIENFKSIFDDVAKLLVK